MHLTALKSESNISLVTWRMNKPTEQHQPHAVIMKNKVLGTLDYYYFLQHFQVYVCLLINFSPFSVLEATVTTKSTADCIYRESWIQFYFLESSPPPVTSKYLQTNVLLNAMFHLLPGCDS